MHNQQLHVEPADSKATLAIKGAAFMGWMTRAHVPAGRLSSPRRVRVAAWSKVDRRQTPRRFTTLACIAILDLALLVAQRTAGTETRTEWRALPIHCPRELSP